KVCETESPEACSTKRVSEKEFESELKNEIEEEKYRNQELLRDNDKLKVLDGTRGQDAVSCGKSYHPVEGGSCHAATVRNYSEGESAVITVIEIKQFQDTETVEEVADNNELEVSNSVESKTKSK